MTRKTTNNFPSETLRKNSVNSVVENVFFSSLRISVLAVSFLLLVFLSSCKDVIKIDLEKGETLLVVDAFVNNLPKTQTIRLTLTTGYFDSTGAPAALGATVNLIDLTNAKTYTFTPDGNGNYQYTPIVNDSMAQVNHSYQLNISYNGTNYTSITKLMRTTKIDTIIFRNSRRGFSNNPADTSNPRRYYPYLVAEDVAGGVDYYWIKTYKNGMFYNKPNQLNVSADAGGGPSTDGKTFIPPVAFFSLVSDPLYRQDVCTIEIHSITADAFDFLTQMKTQMTNAESGLFATTPQNVKTNIKISSGTGVKAIGWFSMSATASKSVTAGN